MLRSTLGLALILAAPLPLHAQDLHVAELGSCALESGQTLEPCDIAYRTWGELNEARDNAILVPTWYGGTSRNHAGFIDSGMLDSETFFIVVVDALGNGVSTSPSNSPTQPGAWFPRISIGDMVESQHRLATEVLGLDHLHAVTGASMGGMQTFEWIVRYPDFMNRAVPTIGSPKLGPYDVALWETHLRLLALLRDCNCEDAAAAMAGVSYLSGRSPEWHTRETDPASVGPRMQNSAEQTLRGDLSGTWNRESQLHAMIGHDVSRHTGGEMAAAVARVRAQLFVVVVGTDHVVTPGPAIAFAEEAGAKLLVLDNDSGHAGLFNSDYGPEVRAFLARD